MVSLLNIFCDQNFNILYLITQPNKMNLIYSIFVCLVWFLSTYFNIVMLLALFTKKDRFYESLKCIPSNELPKVSIIAPAFNEQKTIADSIESLKKINYPKE